jgi:hypothetical protein
MFDTALEMVTTYLPIVLAVMGGLTALAAAIAPFTKTTTDDKLVGVLRWLQDKLAMLSLAKTAAAVRTPAPAARDQRRRK